MPEDPLAPVAPEPPTAVPGEAAPAPTKPKKSRGLQIIVIISLLLLVTLLVGGAYVFVTKNRQEKATQAAAAAAAAVRKQFCYVRISSLVCVDDKGANPTRYDIPLVNNRPVVGLSASPNQSQYVARVAEVGGQTGYFIVDATLKNPKEITGQPGDIIYQPTWSQDGKSLFMEIDPAGVINHATARHIYQYDLATSKVTKLTDSRMNMTPYQLKDGRIIYQSYSGTASPDGTSWVPYVMNPDGSNPQPYAPKLVDKNYYGLNYDQTTDTVYILASSATADANAGKITYFSSSDPTHNQFVNASVSSSDDDATGFYINKLIFGRGIQGTIIDLSSGKPLQTIAAYGPSVGMIKTTKFTKSSSQTEDPHDRIFGLADAPNDFQTFITQRFDDQTKKPCDDPTMEFRISINGVVRDTFAQTSEGGCDGGAAYYYIKKGDDWVKMTATQAALDCALVNQNKFTKQLIPNCIDAKNNVVANTNP